MKKTYKNILMILALLTVLSNVSFAARIETEEFIFQAKTTMQDDLTLTNGAVIRLTNTVISASNGVLYITFEGNSAPVVTDGTDIKYPVFNIPLNSWSEVELKGSTNNFDSGDATYWYESLGTNVLSVWADFAGSDLNGQLFYCNPTNALYDGRAWIFKPNSTSLTEVIGGDGNYQDTVVVVPSLTTQDGSTNTWMYPANDNLVWVYRRRTSSAGETNDSGDFIWHPIYPSTWRKTPMNVSF